MLRESTLINVVKAKALIICAVTAQLICAFVFACATFEIMVIRKLCLFKGKPVLEASDKVYITQTSVHSYHLNSSDYNIYSYRQLFTM